MYVCVYIGIYNDDNSPCTFVAPCGFAREA